MNPDPLIDLFKFDPVLSASIRDMPNRGEVIRYINIGRFLGLSHASTVADDTANVHSLDRSVRDLDDAYEDGWCDMKSSLRFEIHKIALDARSLAGLDQ